MARSARFAIAWTLLGIVGAGVVAADVMTVTRDASAGVVCSSTPPPVDPIETALRFLTTAVEGRQLASSYRLATPAFLHGADCRHWVRRKGPVQHFRKIDWSRSSYNIVARGDGQIVLRVYLYPPKLGAPPEVFLMELRQPEGGEVWRVGFWERTTFQPGELEKQMGASSGPALWS
jgi:hypothetical protein